METKMRAKFVINSIEQYPTAETLKMSAVAKTGTYDPDGADEDNTYAHFSPSGTLSLTIANPALVGTFKVGEKYYMDFTLTNL